MAARLCLSTHAGAMGMQGSTGRPPRKLEGQALPGRDASVPRSSERSICPHRGQIEPDSDGAAPTSTTIAEGRAATRSDSLGDGPAMPSAQGLTNEQSSRVYYRVVEFPC